MTWLALTWAKISLRTKVIGILTALLVFAVFMAVRAHDKSVRDEVHADYKKASGEAVLDAVAGERKANANSAARHDTEDTTKATIQEGIDNAKANGDNPINGYFDGLRKAQSDSGKDKPAK